jgi:hypothetical protein
MNSILKYAMLTLVLLWMIEFDFPLPWAWLHNRHSKSNNKIYYTRGYSYKLVKQFKIKVPIRVNAESKFIHLRDGTLTIDEGYTWDGPTGSPDLDKEMRASLVHDALYELVRNGHLSKDLIPEMNKIFEEIDLEDGDGGFRAEFMYRFENVVGKLFIQKEKVYSSP